ncbi:NADPH:quinone oxidoreductase family protein [Halalkalibacillus halophilus]|uniref:NADPH:quinone oxidoreductase family protein n=1 Tax=Halalkalibacillus halophilus TaxID=392827 RepID=UPI0004179496|nr:NADPH:quinone oxidoreductase family protein [Halalkalibacillus halophilus]
MNTWQVTKLGEPSEALEMKSLEIDSLKPGEVLVNVKAFSLNFFDILQCQGNYQEKPELPFTPGAEAAGIVEEVTSSSSFEVGDRVLITPQLPNGGFSKHVVVKEEDVFPISKQLSYSKAAAMFITYHTAYYALKNRAQLMANETILVHAGSGGVGSAAIQIAKAMGAKVIATAGGEEKTKICSDLGADYVINYREQAFEKIVKELTDHKGTDVIFDPVGGDVFHKSRKCINFSGRILLIGFAGGDMQEAPMNHALIKNYSIVGVHFGYYRKLFPEEVRKAHQELMQLLDQELLDPLIYHAFHFEEVPEALEQLQTRKTWGKVVVEP